MKEVKGQFPEKRETQLLGPSLRNGLCGKETDLVIWEIANRSVHLFTYSVLCIGNGTSKNKDKSFYLYQYMFLRP